MAELPSSSSVVVLEFFNLIEDEHADLSFSEKGGRFERYSACLFKKNCPNALFWATEKLVSMSYAVEIRSVANGNSLLKFHFERFSQARNKLETCPWPRRS
jgi:hypothetical protein